MATLRLALTCAAIVATLSLAACSPSGVMTGSGSSSGATSGGAKSATVPPKSKPTAVPTVTVAFCQGLMTVAEANQFMNPPSPATAIRVDSSAAGGTCGYEYKPFNADVTVTFLSYVGPSDTQSEQAGLAASMNAIKSSVPSASVHTAQVSGIGDTALFISTTAITDNIFIHQDVLDVIYGRVLISCANFNAKSASDATQQADLTQVCQQVIHRL